MMSDIRVLMEWTDEITESYVVESSSGEAGLRAGSSLTTVQLRSESSR